MIKNKNIKKKAIIKIHYLKYVKVEMK